MSAKARETLNMYQMNNSITFLILLALATQTAFSTEKKKTFLDGEDASDWQPAPQYSKTIYSQPKAQYGPGTCGFTAAANFLFLSAGL